MNSIIKKLNLFWQYPVITEKTFNDQHIHNDLFIGFPWATIIDSKEINSPNIINALLKYIDKTNKYYTCCQHIRFRELIPLFKMLNIKTLYTPHKILREDVINGITIIPCPLYAVNIEDKLRNTQYLSNKNNLLLIPRKILCSFQGAYTPKYLTQIRKQIIEAKWPENCSINNKNEWFFQKDVYSTNQNSNLTIVNSQEKTNDCEDYNFLLLNSRYSLCPSGTGPNSIRLWESLAFGAIPIILADTLELPKHPLWIYSVLRIEEKQVELIPSILSKITMEMETEMRQNCLLLYEHFKDNYADNK